MNETRVLSEWATKTGYEDLPCEVVDYAKKLIIDQLGVELACSTLPWSKALFEFIKDRGGSRQESTIVSYGLRTDCESAAFINGSFGHGFEIDDSNHAARAHLGCIVIPTTFAVGEMQRVSGKEFLTALIIGYEIASRVGSAAPSIINRGIHPTSAIGTFGAAAATSKMLNLPEPKVLNSLAIAASFSSGVMEYTETGGSVKRMHGGMAAQGGIRAAFLAERGITGPPTILEGAKGFCQAFSNEFDPSELTGGLGKEFVMLRTGFKYYPCCRAMHSALDAVLALKKEHGLMAADVDHISVGSSELTLRDIGTIREPTDITGMQFSGNFCVALALVKGKCEFEDFDETILNDVQIKKLARRIEFVFDEEMHRLNTGSRGSWGAKVAVQIKNGTILRKTIGAPIGEVENPMSQEQLYGKFRGLAIKAVSTEKARQLLNLIERIEDLENLSSIIPLLVR